MTQRMIEDHKPLVEDLSNTGQELMEMCTEEDASDIKEDIDNVLAKYDNAKMAIRERLNILDDTLRNASSEVGAARQVGASAGCEPVRWCLMGDVFIILNVRSAGSGGLNPD